MRNAGFTLLELLVVLVLLGIILSFAMLSVGDGGRQAQLEQEARRLQMLLHLAGEEAVLQGNELGMQILTDAYLPLVYAGDGWQGLDDGMFRRREMPPGIILQLYLDTHQVSLSWQSETAQAPQPQVILFSSGERTPFELTLGYRDGPPLAYRLQAPMLGSLSLSREDE